MKRWCVCCGRERFIPATSGFYACECGATATTNVDPSTRPSETLFGIPLQTSPMVPPGYIEIHDEHGIVIRRQAFP